MVKEGIPEVRHRESTGSDSIEPHQVHHTVDEKQQQGTHRLHHTQSEVQRLADRLGGDNENLVAPMDDVEYVMDKIDAMTVDEARDIIITMLKEHEYDYNFSLHLREQLTTLLEGPQEKDPNGGDWVTEIKTAAALNKYYSPYPEVRAITTPEDDPDLPCETIRAHLVGLIWAAIAQFTNSLFTSRFPGISLTSAVAQVLIYPTGMLLSFILPDWGFNIRGQRLSLNPGRWNHKEQMLATIITNVSVNTGYCFWNIQTQTIYYKDKWLTPEYEILLLLSTQLLGIGFAGILRRFVVYPVETLWPGLLPTIALNKALLMKEKKETIHRWSISRYKVFFITFGAMFVYFWLPGYLFPALSAFAWMAWIAPDNFSLNVITGNNMLGFNPLPTFDWSVITSFNTSPLAIPFFAYFQMFIGQIIGGFILIAIYWTNKSWTGYLPPNSSSIFDNTGLPYNISRVIDHEKAVVIEEKYQEYSPPFYTAGSLVGYGSFFMFYPITMVFVTLDAWRPILRAFRSMFKSIKDTIVGGVKGTAACLGAVVRGQFGEAGRILSTMFSSDGSIYDGFDDPFTQLMRRYPEVPDWWFLALGFVAFIFSIVILARYPQLDTPVWTIFFVLGINLVFLIPMTYITAISGLSNGLNVVTELIMGYALPGHPEALMFVKAFGYNINGQADSYIGDQKMGFYTRLPPRAMYRGQVLSMIMSAFICYGVVNFVDNTIPGICTPHQKSKFNCATGSAVYFSSSVVWGAIGPGRVFSQLYPAMKYCFLFGFLLSLVWWGLKRFGGQAREALRKTLPPAIFVPLNWMLFKPIATLKHVHPTVVITGAMGWAPNNLSYTTVGVYLSLYFMYYLRRYKTAWWEKYNYVISAGLTGGMAFSGIIIFFAVQWNPVSVNWWGTNIISATIDGGAGRQSLVPIPESGKFGPATWS